MPGVAPAQPPSRFKSGFTPEQAFQAWADNGAGDPFFYHSDSDDFDWSLNVTGTYTKSAGSTGTAALTAGDGGQGLLTTAATLNDYISLQRPIAAWTVPQG